jgi:hypothetical protein
MATTRYVVHVETRVAGHLYIAAVGNLTAILYSGGGALWAAAHLERTYGRPARLLTSIAVAEGDAELVLEQLVEHHRGDGLYSMTQSQVAALIAGLKGEAERKARQRSHKLLQAQSAKRQAAEAAEAREEEAEWAAEAQRHDAIASVLAGGLDRLLAIEAERWRPPDSEQAVAAKFRATVHKVPSHRRRELADDIAFRLREAAVHMRTQGKPVDVADVLQLIDGIKGRGIRSYNGIARELNAQAIPGPRGGKWYPSGVRKLLLQKSV